MTEQAAMDEQERKNQAGIERMKHILRSHDIEMDVGACGCCDSPWVTFIYKGERILDREEYCEFATEGLAILDGDSVA